MMKKRSKKWMRRFVELNAAFFKTFLPNEMLNRIIKDKRSVASKA